MRVFFQTPDDDAGDEASNKIASILGALGYEPLRVTDLERTYHERMAELGRLLAPREVVALHGMMVTGSDAELARLLRVSEPTAAMLSNAVMVKLRAQGREGLLRKVGGL